MAFHMIGAMAEFERDLIRERVTAGMRAAKRAGKHVGRPSRMTASRTVLAREMLAQGKTWGEVARAFEIDKATLGRALKRWPEE